MDRVIWRSLFVLIAVNSIGTSVAQDTPNGGGGLSPWASQLDPLFQAFEYLNHLDGDVLRRVFSDFVTWYRQNLPFGDQVSSLASRLGLPVNNISSGANQASSFVAALSNLASVMSSGDEVEAAPETDLGMQFERLVDSLLPRPAPRTPPTTTEKPLVEVVQNSLGRRFHSSVKSNNVQIQPV